MCAFLGIAVAMLLLFGCASDTTTTSPDTTTAVSSATGPAPGVTDDAIKVGVTYVDTQALLKNGLDYNLGDYEAVYTALFNDINANGGINGRKVEPVFAPIDPTSTQPAEAACLKLTEDADVFLVTGFFLADAVLCPIDTHATAVVGGEMTPERLQRAKAPWLTWAPDTERPAQVVKAMSDAGELPGKVAVFWDARDQEQVDASVMPALHDVGIEPVATGTVDAPANDTAAIDNQVKVISQRFQAAGAETVVLVGASGSNWPTVLQNDPTYRPKLRFLEILGVQSFATNASTTDLSILDGALRWGRLWPRRGSLRGARAAGLRRHPAHGRGGHAGADAGQRSEQPALAGRVPGLSRRRPAEGVADRGRSRPELRDAGGRRRRTPADHPRRSHPRTFGPPPAADGNPAAYLYAWDATAKRMVLKDG